LLSAKNTQTSDKQGYLEDIISIDKIRKVCKLVPIFPSRTQIQRNSNKNKQNFEIWPEYFVTRFIDDWWHLKFHVNITQWDLLTIIIWERNKEKILTKMFTKFVVCNVNSFFLQFNFKIFRNLTELFIFFSRICEMF